MRGGFWLELQRRHSPHNDACSEENERYDEPEDAPHLRGAADELGKGRGI